ncbi:3-hydroxybutyryl-CoA dehydrogenase [Alkalibaculum sp. M08DMB]|uniref:3-hydroxybutyryl-CoA dehydrogenase n=1 Tax=Alkalibaculum sporogenes TaxID=2655001 RepID=A0A6A7K4S4_9FIRM|nr:3-hydroxyacyl-CoA dehydrogenase family protein [Alkalibaculum sporogenes]MPW24459.1 3-hydroxybutyryl-CoA dehydrogenase [Alkalibaculum sporogenes]
MIKRVGVIGAGAMGTGIAHIMAQCGYDVVLNDIDNIYLDKAIKSINTVLDKKIAKGTFTEENKDELIGKIETSTNLNDLKDVDLIVEAIIENIDVKHALFAQLEEICKPETIFASNTSTMSITKLASATKRPEKMAGMHFFNPAPVMKLVEIIRGFYTSDNTVTILKEVVRSLGKDSIEVKKDSPGFVVNRLMLTQFREAFLVLEEGIASIEDIDKAMTLGLNHPMGPFTLMDFTGNDIAYDTLMYMYTEMAMPNWAPPAALKRVVNAGRLGNKIGKGWYDYEKGDKRK